MLQFDHRHSIDLHFAIPVSLPGCLPGAEVVADWPLDARFSGRQTSVSEAAGAGPVDRMNKEQYPFRMFLLGPFALVDAGGRSVTPKSKKAQALLAMLALSTRGSRSRIWLRDKLWSDRSDDQAAASLRQALLDIHKSLGPARDLLIADKNTVWLDTDRLVLDTDLVVRTERSSDQVTDELLEGIDIRDPEFEDWLALERQNWYRRLDEGQVHDVFEPRQQPSRDIAKQSALLPLTGAPDTSRTGKPVDIASSGPYGRRVGGDWQWMMALQSPIVVGAGEGGQIAATRFQNLIAKAIIDGLGFGVTDLSFTLPHIEENEQQISLPLCLQLRLTFDGDMVLIELVMKHLINNRIHWLDSQAINRTQFERGEFGIAAALISQAVDQLAYFQEIQATDSRLSQDGLLIDAVNAIFRLSRDDLDNAERRLEEQIQYQPRSSTFAWLSFIRTFQVGQRFNALDAHLIEEAQAYARKALELDPQNSVSLALVGHVHSFLFGEYDYAANLFEKSIRLNPALPLGWDLYAMLHCYAGQPDKAVAMARWVQELGVYSPHKYYFDTTKCIAAALAGDHAAAIAAGEEALRARPNFNSLLRYLASSHAHSNDLGGARHYLQRLEAVEGDFSINAFRGSGYPLLDTGGGQILIDGLLKAGAKLR
ncbi:SARP family transcriptional regulator [Rhizobium laguerreae]|uniref:SARP family transcriptional regulator n=1 Tax=Rhizobium laguerreae TaxID=1076926 RepID=UPI001039798D|nr:SARP family transcriptional regulator [Rhizobium laguerreae]MBY3299858.1 SARP family transcriptional regulator [Rhizobium laguerreae]MBY3393934.1 SARP family transcriptional regulator [Rhizobium laguerreae]MBY3421463.1 SARP family transcriptional regulator [Rhizobium laguerreae]MBY3471796.1 SARP family transcriptional regulator [Rhizobium laguerreae]MBY3493550.1 SARP family transcriptional regulator [Rhizobium laguerreae]